MWRWTSQERSFLGTREECPAAHTPGATETGFGIKELSVKMQQESYEHFYVCFCSNFQLLSSLVSVLKTWRQFQVLSIWENYCKDKVCPYIPLSSGTRHVLVVHYVADN